MSTARTMQKMNLERARKEVERALLPYQVKKTVTEMVSKVEKRIENEEISKNLVQTVINNALTLIPDQKVQPKPEEQKTEVVNTAKSEETKNGAMNAEKDSDLDPEEENDYKSARNRL